MVTELSSGRAIPRVFYGKTAGGALEAVLTVSNKVQTDVIASALPSGAATSAKQDTGNSSLSSINGKLPALSGGKVPVEATVNIVELVPRVLTHVNIDFSNAAAQTIIAAPAAGNRIRIAALELSALFNVEVAMKSGSTTIGTYRGIAIVPTCNVPINLGTAEAFVLQATTADRITGRISYYTEAV